MILELLNAALKTQNLEFGSIINALLIKRKRWRRNESISWILLALCGLCCHNGQPAIRMGWKQIRMGWKGTNLVKSRTTSTSGTHEDTATPLLFLEKRICTVLLTCYTILQLILLLLILLLLNVIQTTPDPNTFFTKHRRSSYIRNSLHLFLN